MAVTIPGAGPGCELAQKSSRDWDEGDLIHRVIGPFTSNATIADIPVCDLDAAEYPVAMRCSMQARTGANATTLIMEKGTTTVFSLTPSTSAKTWVEDITPADSSIMAAGSDISVSITNASADTLTLMTIEIITRPAIGGERLG